MSPEQTVLDLMETVPYQLGHRPVSQRFSITSPYGHCACIRNRIMSTGELKPPSHKKVRLQLSLVKLNPCSACGKDDVQVPYCPGCFNAIYCSGACHRKDWANHKRSSVYECGLSGSELTKKNILHHLAVEQSTRSSSYIFDLMIMVDRTSKQNLGH